MSVQKVNLTDSDIQYMKDGNTVFLCAHQGATTYELRYKQEPENFDFEREIRELKKLLERLGNL